MSFGTDGAIRSLEERRECNMKQVERLMDLCDASIQRMTESTDGHEIDDLRGEIARYRHEIITYETENMEIEREQRGLKSRSGS